MERLSFHDRKHIQKMLLTNNHLESYFLQFIQKISPQLAKWISHSNQSVWAKNPIIEAAIDTALIELRHNMFKLFKEDQIDAWSRSVAKNDELVHKYIKGLQLSSTLKEGLFSRNIDAYKAFANRVIDGMNLSDRVWKLTESAKTQLEFYLKTGLSSGSSAAKISQDIRLILNNPDACFRRIRNEEGKLIMSQPMRDYKPGMGVYKSSYQNAIRLASTEINMAYRTSDFVRWNQLDFVTGIKIQRSGNGKPCRVCDQLIGDYPKEFKFVGFHPGCICFSVPLMLDQDDFLDMILEENKHSDQRIKTLPASTINAMNEVKKGIEERGVQAPYWYKDNAHLLK